MNIVINGRRKMGQALLTCVPKYPTLNVVGQFGRDGGVENVIQSADVVLDFSSHTATPALAELCATHKRAMVIGTTGHTDAELQRIHQSAATIPIVMASNFSLGVNVLFWLTEKAAEKLGPDFDLEVVEMHHRDKADAPSGTAKTLAGILKSVRGGQFKAEVHRRQRGSAYVSSGRTGNVGQRDSSEIAVHAVRGGGVVGDHTVIFADDGERVELVHKGISREAFANGALRAVGWVVGQDPGLYNMQNVLGLR